ncbi:hypothetical protein CRG98_031521, partial [Punica granatum]
WSNWCTATPNCEGNFCQTIATYYNSSDHPCTEFHAHGGPGWPFRWKDPSQNLEVEKPSFRDMISARSVSNLMMNESITRYDLLTLHDLFIWRTDWSIWYPYMMSTSPRPAYDTRRSPSQARFTHITLRLGPMRHQWAEIQPRFYAVNEPISTLCPSGSSWSRLSRTLRD